MERVPEWENETPKNGMMFLLVEDNIYPDCIRITTINSELCALTASDSAFMNPVIEPDIFSLEENELFSHMMRVTYPEGEEADNDYRYEWDLHEKMMVDLLSFLFLMVIKSSYWFVEFILR